MPSGEESGSDRGRAEAKANVGEACRRIRLCCQGEEKKTNSGRDASEGDKRDLLLCPCCQCFGIRLTFIFLSLSFFLCFLLSVVVFSIHFPSRPLTHFPSPARPVLIVCFVCTPSLCPFAWTVVSEPLQFSHLLLSSPSAAMSVSSASSGAKPAAAQAMQIPSRMKNPATGQFIPLSSTPGGSLYGTTPGGTRIQYDRSVLLGYRNSPLSKSPAMLPQSILNLGVTADGAQAIAIPEERLKAPPAATETQHETDKRSAADEQDEELFEMDS